MEKYTKEQLNAMDKEALVQMLYNTQQTLYNTQQLLETLVKQNQELTETIALPCRYTGRSRNWKETTSESPGRIWHTGSSPLRKDICRFYGID